MTAKRIVITGLGIVSPIGIGKDAFFNSLANSVSGIKPVSLFDTASFKVKSAGEASNFKPEDILGPKGLRTLDRSTKLVNAATKLALDNAQLVISEENTRKVGVSIGNTLGSINSICDFDKEALTEGVQYVNPALFPNTVINSPASQVSIRFNIKGFNATISTGFSASLDAIDYAVNAIRLGKAEIVLAGGVEELCFQIFLGFYRTQLLAGIKEGSVELSCPFDKRRNGIIFGEGSYVLVLESLECALERKANIYAEILGFGMGFNSGLTRAMQIALKESRLNPEDIDYVCAGANSTAEGDLSETQAIKEVFAKNNRMPLVSSVKSMLGESFSASGAMQVASALFAINKQTAPATINYQYKDPLCDLDYVVNQPRKAKIERVLINTFGLAGRNSSLVISKFKN